MPVVAGFELVLNDHRVTGGLVPADEVQAEVAHGVLSRFSSRSMPSTSDSTSAFLRSQGVTSRASCAHASRAATRCRRPSGGEWRRHGSNLRRKQKATGPRRWRHPKGADEPATVTVGSGQTQKFGVLHVDLDTITAGAAVVAAGAAALQLWRLRTDKLDARAAEIDSVSLQITVLERPTESDRSEGVGRYVYELTIHNPGRLPISNVTATLTFPVAVQRSHYDGSIDDASTTMVLSTPVIAPGGVHSRRRTLLIPTVEGVSLDATTATVDFSAADVGEHRTLWPTQVSRRSRALRRRLGRKPRRRLAR